MWQFLKHKFVLPFLGIYECEAYGMASQFFLVSPYMGNGTLDQWRKQSNPSVAEIEKRVWLLFLQLFISWSDLLKILQVAQGLEYIHSEGIVHGCIRGVVFHLHVYHVKLLPFSLGKYSPG